MKKEYHDYISPFPDSVGFSVEIPRELLHVRTDKEIKDKEGGKPCLEEVSHD
jgi:hypothetical protein